VWPSQSSLFVNNNEQPWQMIASGILSRVRLFVCTIICRLLADRVPLLWKLRPTPHAEQETLSITGFRSTDPSSQDRKRFISDWRPQRATQYLACSTGTSAHGISRTGSVLGLQMTYSTLYKKSCK
jgi:hypothetical protein